MKNGKPENYSELRQELDHLVATGRIMAAVDNSNHVVYTCANRATWTTVRNALTAREVQDIRHGSWWRDGYNHN